jgi:hypothetical protein
VRPPALPAGRRALAGLAGTAVVLSLAQPAAADHTGAPERLTLMGSLLQPDL